MIEINAGPTVTQFGVEPGWDIKTRRVKERDKDGNINDETNRFPAPASRWIESPRSLMIWRCALAAPTIRIEAPVPVRPYRHRGAQ